MDQFARTCEEIARHPGRIKKLRALASYLRPLDDADLVRAVRFASGQPLESDRKGLAIGGSTLREAAVAASGVKVELIRFCNREVGDSAETISLLMMGKAAGEPLSLAEAEEWYRLLQGTRQTAAKIALLRDGMLRWRPETLKYLLKVITGNLRIGLQEKLVEEAVALATGQAADDVRQASNRSGDLASVALAARHGHLAQIEARLFQPMDFMLARPLDNLEDLETPADWTVEDKFDGIRVQAHLADGRVKLFSRGMEEVTGAYPELVLALAQMPGSLVLDGELLGWREERALPFQMLQQRLARKRVTAQLMSEVPVGLVAYDLLFDDGTLLLDAPIEERRRRLELRFAAQGFPLLLSKVMQAETRDEVEALFQQARSNGNEGLLLKRRGSLYEAGKRGGAWLKVKRPYATLDVVVTAAEQGRGRRATMLSDYTFGVRHGDRFLNVGKAYSGLTDEEIRELTRLLRSLTVERYGRVALVKPEVVLEVAFDGIQLSPRHKSGYAMRFPRILRWRKDKRPEEADDLERVRQLYEGPAGSGG